MRNSTRDVRNSCKFVRLVTKLTFYINMENIFIFSQSPQFHSIVMFRVFFTYVYFDNSHLSLKFRQQSCMVYIDFYLIEYLFQVILIIYQNRFDLVQKSVSSYSNRLYFYFVSFLVIKYRTVIRKISEISIKRNLINLNFNRQSTTRRFFLFFIKIGYN